MQCNASRLWWQCSSGPSHLLGEQLAKISILTSLVVQPVNLSHSSYEWVRRDYRIPPYAAVGIVDFKPVLMARHVAVYSENTQALSLAEVEIYGKA